MPPPRLPPDDSPLQAEAGALALDLADERVTLSGAARVAGRGLRVNAQALEYQRASHLLESHAPVEIETRQLRVQAQGGRFDPVEGRGELESARYRLFEPRGRGTARKIEILDARHSRFERIDFTTCPPGNQGFVLSADEMTVDRETQVAHFKDASLHFLGVPLFWAPRFSLPLTDARRSGLLVPTLGYDSENGVDLTAPWYFNLAPNYDFTLLPRLLSRRGLLLGGEFRFLLPAHQGIFNAEILPHDRIWDGAQPRGALHAATRSRLGPGLKASLDLNWVSDDHYLEDLGRSLAVTSTRHLRNRLALEWNRPTFDMLAEVRHYDTLDPDIPAHQRPYSLLPRLAFHWVPLPTAWGLEYGFDGELVHFYRDDSTTGQRLDLAPRLALAYGGSWWNLVPSLEGRYTAYMLQDQAPGLDDRPTRATFTAALDGSLHFEREARLFDTDLLQTLEPRLHYLYTPYRNQDDLPLFDTGLLDFTFDNLFRGNRFNGPDRVGDANQMALALTSRLIDRHDGRELLRADLGQIYYFRDRRVRLDPEDPPLDASSSSIIAQVSAGLVPGWQLEAGVQVDPHHPDRKLRQGLARARWQGDDGAAFLAAWRLREDALEQADLAAIWPLTPRLKLIGRWFYSLEEDHLLEAVAGLEYNDCCWRLRAVARHYLDGPDEAYNDTLLLELELHGLGTLGNNIDRFLDRTIHGY